MQTAKLRKKEEISDSLDPLVKEWFFSCFKEFSEPQLFGVMPIFERKYFINKFVEEIDKRNQMIEKQKNK